MRLMKLQHSHRKITGIDAKRYCISLVTVRRNSTTPGLDLRNERVVFEADPTCKVTLTEARCFTF